MPASTLDNYVLWLDAHRRHDLQRMVESWARRNGRFDIAGDCRRWTKRRLADHCALHCIALQRFHRVLART